MFCSLRGSCSSLAIVIALTGFGAAQASAQDQPDPASGDPAAAAEAQDDPAVIVVSGIRESIDARASVAWSPNATMTITGDGGWQNLRYPGSRILQTTDAFDIGAI